MKPVLARCIENICVERDNGWDTVFDSVHQLVEEYGESGLADRVINEVPRIVPFEVVADLLNILIWSTSDNGSAITTSANSWLRDQTDNRKILIALNLGVIPFSSEYETKDVLIPLMQSNSHVSSHCARMLNFWEKEN
jgi:hypothetical protein